MSAYLYSRRSEGISAWARRSSDARTGGGNLQSRSVGEPSVIATPRASSTAVNSAAPSPVSSETESRSNGEAAADSISSRRQPARSRLPRSSASTLRSTASRAYSARCAGEANCAAGTASSTPNTSAGTPPVSRWMISGERELTWIPRCRTRSAIAPVSKHNLSGVTTLRLRTREIGPG